MISETESLKFDLAAGIDGGIADGLNFNLHMQPSDTAGLEEVSKVPEKPVIRKDTTYLIVHEVIQELVTIDEDSYAIQLGAFKRKPNADAYRRKLENLLGRKVDIIIEGDFFKVRINGLKDRKEVNDLIAILHKNGVNELWVIMLKAKQQQWVLTEKQDTVTSITETLISAFSPEMAIDVGSFRQETVALTLKNRLSAILGKKITIVFEDGYYKVRISGFTSLEDLEKIIPSLGLIGLRDIWMAPVKKQPLEKTTVVVKPDAVLMQLDTTRNQVEEKVAAPVTPAEPTVALQVALFNNRSQALIAQKRIINKLNLPVEIVQQWDYYKVIVTGFYTREETYKYYPELAGLGYPNITLIENYKRQE
jgi:cell division protein FtsN